MCLIHQHIGAVVQVNGIFAVFGDAKGRVAIAAGIFVVLCLLLLIIK